MYFQLQKQINMASLSEENLQLYNPIFSNQVWFPAVSLNYRKCFQRPLKKLKSKHAFQVTAKKKKETHIGVTKSMELFQETAAVG